MSRSLHLRDHHTCPDSADPHIVKTNEYLLYIDPSVVLRLKRSSAETDLEGHDFYTRTNVMPKKASSGLVGHQTCLSDFQTLKYQKSPLESHVVSYNFRFTKLQSAIWNDPRCSRTSCAVPPIARRYSRSSRHFRSSPSRRSVPSRAKARSTSARRANCALSMAPRRTARVGR